ncbi:MAG: hypothetical protein ABI461_24230 [Polyangiaceae bacterium]
MRFVFSSLGAAALAVTMFACATATLNEDSDGGITAQQPDASTHVDYGGDAGHESNDAAATAESGIACGDGGTACGTSCVTTSSDLENCGACNVVCVGADASCGASECKATLHVNALIDGESQLVIVGNTAHWHHLSYSTPGSWNGNNAPTKFDTTNLWYPTWPGGSCTSCDSSNTATVTPLAAKAQTVSLVSSGRDSLTISQQPSATNSFTLIVDFNDVSTGGGAYYEADLTYVTH